MKQKGKIYIGTSGWHYKHWLGTFYPEGVKEKTQLSYYTTQFKTVELNNSFYRLPTPETFSGWAAAVPNDFLFVVKASRFFTHMKKLNLTPAELKPFFNAVDRLGKKLGPVLFQLPPFWKVNSQRFEHFLSILPKGYKYTFEFRNDTWYTEEIYDLLRKYKCAFCWYHLAGHISPQEVTANFVYIRLHGPGEKYQGSYTTAALKSWATVCKELSNEGKTVYVYFDNDQAGYAAFNALKLAELVK